MKDKNIVKKILGSILRKRKQSFFDRQIMHAKRDWLVGLLAGLLLIVYAGNSSYQTYMTYRSISPSQSADLPTDTLYREPMTKTVLEDFETRKKIHEDLKSKLINERRVEVVNKVEDRDTENEEGSTEASVPGEATLGN